LLWIALKCRLFGVVGALSGVCFTMCAIFGTKPRKGEVEPARTGFSGSFQCACLNCKVFNEQKAGYYMSATPTPALHQTLTALLPSPRPSSSPNVFARTEEKYLLDSGSADLFCALLGNRLALDGNGEALIGSLYLDTPSNQLIRRSIEKPDYKEKLRIRIYGPARTPEHQAFLELKKKLNGTVYKRRVGMTLQEAKALVEQGQQPYTPFEGKPEKVALNRQILEELNFSLQRYGKLGPAIRLDYEREAYNYQPENGSVVRITIDRDVLWRPGDWDFANLNGHSLLAPEQRIMEIKTSGALPLEMVHALAELEIYPRSFSKVGTAYQQFCKEGMKFWTPSVLS
jgi:hypothetical protein